MDIDKRQKVRRPINVSIVIGDGGQAVSCNAISADLSMGGIGLFTAKEDIQPGQLYNLRFDLLVRGKYMNVNAQAKVVHKSPHKYHGYTVGLEFMDIDDSSSLTIKSFVESFRKATSNFAF